MKRGWEPSTTSSYGIQPGTTGEVEDSAWVHMSQHPYASAYSSLPNPFTPSSLHDQQYGYTHPIEKKPRMSMTDAMNGSELGSERDEDEEDEEDEEGEGGRGLGRGRKGKGDKPKTKLTRGSRACVACRKIKMRCIQDESNGPGGPCKRCRNGGHECIFEESNRGKRSTRKNEALTARVNKMDNALRGIGAALSNLDQPSLNAFSTALHTVISDPDTINLITSHTAPSAVPTLAVAMNRQSYSSDNFSEGMPYNLASVRGEDSAQNAHAIQPPLSPRLHSLPDNVLSPLGLLAEASLHNTDGKKNVGAWMKGSHRPSPLSLGERSAMLGRPSSAMSSSSYRMATSDVRGREGEEAEDVKPEVGRGVASQNYFKPGVVTANTAGASDNRVPELMTMVTREEIDELFVIFFDHMAPNVPLIYKEYHTPELILQRSQFLCTVICALAARYYNKNLALLSQLSSYAKRLAFEVPSRGYKSVEVCQAYLLLSMWTLGPEKTFEQDRTWMMLGMAIRMATDLNLHRKSVTSGLDTDEGRGRDLEIINRERCWLHCFVLDRSLSAQMGKPYTLREDYIIRNACEASWHRQRFSLPSDRPLSAYVVLQQIMSRAIDSIYSSTTTASGLRQDCDYMLIVRSAHEELRRWLTEWNKPETSPGSDPKQDYDSRAQFYFAYHSLVLYSFGLENAIERAKTDVSFFLTNVYEAATRVCTVVKEEFLPKGYLPYLPDSNFVMCSYALLSLLKLLKPELRPFHDSEEPIFTLVTEMADVLEESAVDPSHQPAIYSAFIREIVRKTREARILSPIPASTVPPTLNGSDPIDTSAMYDPQLLNDSSNWTTGDLMNTEGAQFAFIPQGGDMMILPSAAGPSESIQNSPSASFNFPIYPNAASTPQTSAGWAEYLPTFMSADGFDGWDGSMLLPGFGRGQITLGGGLLHSQYGSGIMTPAQRTPSQSRSGSRSASRAATPD